MNDERPAATLLEKTIGIVGVGLIGGSIAAALKKRGFGGQIIGIGRSAARLQEAQAAGHIDEFTTDVAEAAANCDLMIFCTPVDRIVDGVITAAAKCSPGTLITDAGSVKGSICRALDEKLPDGVTFIGSHPLAGSEKNGFEHADADLYVGRTCVTTWDIATPQELVERLTLFWESLGLDVVVMTARDHDAALAETSHLPHVVAAALVAALSAANRNLAASGFADTTRIASGDPDLWTAILLANAEAVSASLTGYMQQLDEFQTAITNRDADVLKKLLQVAKRNRNNLE
jgi:prephenate dehydrogenase